MVAIATSTVTASVSDVNRQGQGLRGRRAQLAWVDLSLIILFSNISSSQTLAFKKSLCLKSQAKKAFYSLDSKEFCRLEVCMHANCVSLCVLVKDALGA